MKRKLNSILLKITYLTDPFNWYQLDSLWTDIHEGQEEKESWAPTPARFWRHLGRPAVAIYAPKTAAAVAEFCCCCWLPPTTKQFTPAGYEQYEGLSTSYGAPFEVVRS